MKETKFKQTEVGMIPSDWEVTTIGDFCKVYDGTHQTPNYVDFGIPFYSVENVSADDFEHTKYI
jgi:type I restriction enzyme S subunit